MKTRHYLSSFVIAAAIALALQSCGPAYVSVVPGRPYYDRPPSPYVGGVWIDGGYNYRTGNYYNGTWGRPQRGRSYYPGEWSQHSRGYSYKKGHWR